MLDYILVSLSDLLNTQDANFEKINNALKSFSCSGETDLEKFLLENSVKYECDDIGKTYLLLEKDAILKEGQLKIMAFFTIALNTLSLSNLSKKRKKKIIGSYPGRDSLDYLPVYLIGQLGRSDCYSHEDLPGSKIMNECAKVLDTCKNIIGGKLVILECRDDLQKVYMSYGFEKFSDINDKGLYTYYKRIDEFVIQ